MMHWTDYLPYDVNQRLGECRNVKEDIPVLATARWKEQIVQGKEISKEDALIYVLEHLDCNSQNFDLSQQAYNECLLKVGTNVILKTKNPDKNWNKVYNTDEWLRYFDNTGTELHEGDFVSIGGAKPQKLYRTTDGQLGIDATNPSWIERGRACECEYGIYSLNREDMENIVAVNPNDAELL